jgi:hypothetical protein
VPTVRAVERRIYGVEGFDVVIRHLDGRNVRSDREKLPQYPYKRAMASRSDVKDWKEGRFQPHYPGFKVDVLDAYARRVHGGTKLSTVRDTFFDE